MSGNEISDVSALGNLTKLTELRASNNKITDIEALSGLVDLESLHIDSNNISDVSALSNLTKLAVLTAKHNPIKDLTPIQNMPNRKEYWGLPTADEIAADEERKKEVENTVSKYGRKEGFSYQIAGGGAAILGYDRFEDRITIPENVEGFPVTKICDSAFKDIDFLRIVKIPESVKHIGESAFNGCGEFTIHCYKNSAAHTFATDMNISFEIMKAARGDTNNKVKS
jgi:hypothetical protein